MASRRVFLTVALLAAALLVFLPSAALAAQWLSPEPLPSSFPSVADPAVATDVDGNSIAVWIDQDESPAEVRAVYRPRGGPWEDTTIDLEPDFRPLIDIAARAVALPDGSFVVVWVADRSESDDVLRSATRSPAGVWTTEDVRDLPDSTEITDFEAGADGSVMVLSLDEGASVSNTKPSPSAPWGGAQFVGIGDVGGLAVGPDGGAVAVGGGVCSESSCVRASYRPAGGEWGEQETVGIIDRPYLLSVAVTANPDGTATAAWAVTSDVSESPGPPGDILSADRSPGPGGTWSAEPDTVAHLESDEPNCGLRCLDIATGADGAQLAAWPQIGASGDQIAASVRSGGGDWVGPETVGATINNDAAHAAITTSGVPVVAWSSNANNSADANASHRDAAGDWNPVLLDSSGDDSVSLGDFDPDGDGNALTAYRHRGGVFAAAFDGAGPRFGTVSLPAGVVGQALPFSATADDNWSTVAGISWLFGDGTGAAGASVSHVYGAAGGYVATARATDTSDNVTELSGPVNVLAAPTPEPTVTPDPCGTADTDKDGIKNGCDDNNGAARPVAFKTVNATVVSGDVFVKLPAGAARASQAAQPPKGFVRLEGAETIPVGATLDTGKGRVRLRTASDTRKHVQTADFFRGRFVVRQVRQPRRKGQKRRSTKLITDIVLNGSSFRRACRTTTASIAQKRRRSKKRVRRLFGDGKGTFRTRGRNAAATVRGTRWSVQDRCDGTLVTVQRGRVEVRDLVKRKTVIVRTGRKYLARRR